MSGKRSKQLLLALVGLLATPFVAEIAIRMYRDVDHLRPGTKLVRDAASWGDSVHRHSDVPGLAYELKPDLDREARGMHVRTSSLGMRGPEPLLADTPGLFRIAALGDSITFGYGVAEQQAWPMRLGAALADEPPCADRTFEVLDFAVSGYSTRDEVVAYRHKGLPLEPDLVVLGYFFNDPDCEPTQPLQRHFTEPEWWHHSALLRWCALVRENAARKRLAGNDHWRYLHHPETRNWKSVARGFADLRALTVARGVPVVVVIFPLMSAQRPWPEYPYGDLHDRVRAEAEANGFQVVELIDAYARYDPAELMLGPNDYHPTPRAHEIVRDVLLAHLEAHPELLCGPDRD